MKHKYIPIILIICILFLAAIGTGVIVFRQKTMQQTTEYVPTPTPNDTITPTPIFTGVKEWKPSEDQQKQIEQAFTLRSKLPLQVEFFSLTFDYNKNMFVVSFTSTDPQNSEKFTTWRIQQGFGDIPESKFRYHSS